MAFLFIRFSPGIAYYIFIIDGLKGPLLVYTNHINNRKHMHHGFLAPRAYLCSTSLNIFNRNKENASTHPGLPEIPAQDFTLPS